MISNEERREVVQWMRCIARLWQEKIPNGKLNDNENKEAVTFELMEHMGLDEESPVHEFYARLADLIDRPTCRNEDGFGRSFLCSACGYEAWTYDDSGCDPKDFSFCPNCGAEEVRNGD